ncbi:hypothetical protein KM295_10280 [Natronomonas sp. F2-12]|uniref:Uncharacterized protein n=1 Tax=Natronomonas aquatica TaxID=2841590 RepID=A0A9R1CUI3_9EURY|nr:hypothetical protein [Natronomonas aquatica]MCQ4333861.1 hypothetical protein [Natronomonas aquatica]
MNPAPEEDTGREREESGRRDDRSLVFGLDRRLRHGDRRDGGRCRHERQKERKNHHSTVNRGEPSS